MRRRVHSFPLAWSAFETPCGWVGLLVSDQGLYEVVIGESRAALFQRRYSYDTTLNSTGSAQLLANVKQTILDYFRNPGVRCDPVFDCGACRIFQSGF